MSGLDANPVSKQRLKMNPPYAKRVRVEQKKIVEYLLSVTHPDGSSKARFFSRLVSQPRDGPFSPSGSRSMAGPIPWVLQWNRNTRYTVDGELPTPDGRKPRIRTVWMLSKKSKSPRLITAYPI
jgi:hypothetical protein